MQIFIRLFSSSVKKKPFYVTTPIFYVNAAPHLGHLYSAVVADAIQRFEKLVNPEANVIFSTGTDEHGIKIQRAAEKANLPLPKYCDIISTEYKKLFKDFEVDNTDFIRTTETRHKTAVNNFWRKLKKDDYIYKANYAGWYSVSDETFVPESQTKEETTKQGTIRVSTESGDTLEWTEETNYMFRLSEFQERLTKWLQTDGVIMPNKFQDLLLEILQTENFRDISVSRPASRVHWAIPVPDDEEQSIYVWLDALVNYLTVIGYPDERAMESRGGPWPADVQVIGKDIIKFHGIYWPAFLMAIGWQPPRRLVCHSHWTVDGHKMSKSRGNVVAPRQVPSPTALRYVLLREATMATDANYSETKLINIANSELANTLGNLFARSSGAVLNPRAERPPLDMLAPPPPAAELLAALDRLPDTCYEHYSKYQFYKAVDAVIHTMHLANAYMEVTRPWEMRKKPECQKELDVILHIVLETLRICSIILQPIIPDISKTLLDRLQVPEDCRYWRNLQPTWSEQGAIIEAKKIQGGKFVLFNKIDTDKKKVVQKKATA